MLDQTLSSWQNLIYYCDQQAIYLEVAK